MSRVAAVAAVTKTAPTRPAKPRKPRFRIPKPIPPPEREYLTRPELLSLVPLSMGSVDSLEKRGEFPSRFRLMALNKVAWKRSEVIAFLEKCARDRVHGKPRPGAA